MGAHALQGVKQAAAFHPSPAENAAPLLFAVVGSCHLGWVRTAQKTVFAKPPGVEILQNPQLGEMRAQLCPSLLGVCHHHPPAPHDTA